MILSDGEWKQHAMEQTLLQPAKTTGSHNNDQNLPSITAGNKWPGPNVTSVLYLYYISPNLKPMQTSRIMCYT